MKNLFLSTKSESSHFTKIFIKLEIMQKELRHQRVDLQNILTNLATIVDSIQTTPEDTTEHIPEEEGI